MSTVRSKSVLNTLLNNVTTTSTAFAGYEKCSQKVSIIKRKGQNRIGRLNREQDGGKVKGELWGGTTDTRPLERMCGNPLEAFYRIYIYKGM